jgi:MFS family permease
LALAFLVNTAFLWSALTDGYQVFEIKRFLIPIEAASGSIEKSLGSNERLSVADMRKILDRQRQAIDLHWQRLKSPGLDSDVLAAHGLVHISIVLKSGSKIVTTASDGAESETPAELVDQIQDISTGESLSGLEFVEDNNSYYVPHLLFDNRGRWFGSLVFHFDKEALRNAVAPRLSKHFAPSIIIGVFSVVAIFLLNFQLILENRVIKKRGFIVDFVLIMLVSLSCSLLVNAIIFERQILEVSADNARVTTAEISSRLNERLSQRKTGTTSSKQQGIFADSFSLFDSFESIVLTDTRGKSVFRHQPERSENSPIESILQTAIIGHLPESQFTVTEKLDGISLKDGSDVSAVIQISKRDIFRSSTSLLVKGITIFFITTLVMVECLLFYLHLLTKRRSASSRAPRFELGFIRPCMFLFLFAIDLSLSFVPLHMQSFDSELFGMSRDIVLGLPISAEFLCVGIFLLVAGVWMDRRGWHEPFFIGLVVVGIGTLCSWATNSALLFILSRALVGVGYGLTLMSAQGLVIKFSGANGRALGFAGLFAGLYSGSICGAAAGAILAERFGYGKVFFLGAVVVLVLILFSWKYLHSAIEPSKPDAVEKTRKKIRLVPLLKFIGNPVFIALNLFSSLPASIAVAGFLHFFTPVYLDQIGARDSTIGQVLILYGICLIYFGPPIGRLIDNSNNKKYFMLAGGLLGALAFATFNTDFGIASMVASVILLGVSSSFVLSSQSTIVLELKESKELGEGAALGIFRSISRIGQVVGPMIFGWVLLSGELTDVINYLGFSYIGAILILAAFLINHPGDLKHQRLALQNS